MSDGLTDGCTLLTLAFLCCAYSHCLWKAVFCLTITSTCVNAGNTKVYHTSCKLSILAEIELFLCAIQYVIHSIITDGNMLKFIVLG